MVETKDRGEIVPQGKYHGPWALMSEFDKMFDDVDRLFWRPRLSFNSMVTSEGARIPRVNIKDEGKTIVVQAEMPGVSKENLELNVHDDYLEIRAVEERGTEEKDEETGYFRREMYRSSFYRQVPLPDEIDPKNSEAELRDGILTVTMNKVKTEKKEKHKIKVK
jgi:HSP20 family protein